jgi:serine/threonine protein kinase
MCYVQVALDVARGLHFLHSSGVIHRCSKPHRCHRDMPHLWRRAVASVKTAACI